MPLFELKVEIPFADVTVLEELLSERDDLQFIVLEDKAPSRVWVAGYFESAGAARDAWEGLSCVMVRPWTSDQPVLREVPDEDWKNSYKAHFRAWKFGRLNWVPVWERDSFMVPAGEQVLWLDPGMAFGTGNHETTRLVVERLVQFAAERGVRGRVIDAGCGSGILALSAVKLGYNRVGAFDNDPVAVEISRQNAELNGLTGEVDFFVGDLVTGLQGRQAEMVLANIQADILEAFATQLIGAVAPEGTLVLSGILASELEHVRSVFSAKCPGWAIDSRVMGEWSDLIAVRGV